ncbi:hypothetical protein KBTX_04495 [wastewater metagenome]|uniref:Uncharacterized protein n=2 Tax=unclassified sequences TaxID=12908 RepID=A0A5B8RGC4_9ZZZZ|nr:hypothetical protein KBTEX_04495 [uncultured organism]
MFDNRLLFTDKTGKCFFDIIFRIQYDLPFTVITTPACFQYRWESDFLNRFVKFLFIIYNGKRRDIYSTFTDSRLFKFAVLRGLQQPAALRKICMVFQPFCCPAIHIFKFIGDDIA